MAKRRGQRSDASGRSAGEGKHVRLHRWLLQSAAYRSLAVGPRAALVELYDLYTGTNNGYLFLSARDAAERLGTHKDRASVWLWELESHGFIRPRQSGSFDWKARTATTWVLTEHPFPAGTPATKDFMRWRAGDNFASRPSPKIKTRSNGLGQTVQRAWTARAPKAPNCPTGSDRFGVVEGVSRPSPLDTDSIPRGEGKNGTAALPPTSPPQALPSQETSDRTASNPPACLPIAAVRRASRKLGARRVVRGGGQ